MARARKLNRRERRAMKNYKRTWNRFDHLFGAEGQRAPTIKMYRKGEDRGTHNRLFVDNENGRRFVGMAPSKVKQLANLRRKTKGGRAMRRHANMDKRELRSSLLHEFAHTYQDFKLPQFQQDAPEFPSEGSTGSRGKDMREGSAAQFQRHYGMRLIRGPRRGKAAKKGPTHRRYKSKDYGHLSKHVRKNLPREWWRRGQFGQHYGKDPRKIGPY